MLAAELRFEAIYYGVLGAFAIAVLVARFDWAPAQVAGLCVVAGLACAAAFALSVRGRLAAEGEQAPDGRGSRERTQRMFPLIMLLALLAVAGGQDVAGVAAACLAGWAAAALAGFVLVRRG